MKWAVPVVGLAGFGTRLRYFLAIASRNFLPVTCALFVLAAACQRREQAAERVKISFAISPNPPRVGNATVNIMLADATAKPIAGAVVDIEGDMAHPGMAPAFGHAGETSPGHYRGTLNLTMPGDWAVLLHVSLPNGEKFERRMDVRGVRMN